MSDHESVFNTPIKNIFDDRPEKNRGSTNTELELISALQQGRVKIRSRQRVTSESGRPSVRVTLEYEE